MEWCIWVVVEELAEGVVPVVPFGDVWYYGIINCCLYSLYSFVDGLECIGPVCGGDDDCYSEFDRWGWFRWFSGSGHHGCEY